VGATGHDADGPGRFGDELGGEVGERVAGDGAADEPAARLKVGEGGAQEGRGLVDVFYDFEEGDDVEGLRRSGRLPCICFLTVLALAQVFL